MTVTGSIFPMGDGGVGKTALSRAMAEFTDGTTRIECIDGLKKTVNMEFEFVNCKCTTSDEAILLQDSCRRLVEVEHMGRDADQFPFFQCEVAC